MKFLLLCMCVLVCMWMGASQKKNDHKLHACNEIRQRTEDDDDDLCSHPRLAVSCYDEQARRQRQSAEARRFGCECGGG